MKKLSLLLSCILTSACTTATINLHTNPPGAEVYARSIGGKDLVLLGKTPISISNYDIDKKSNGSGAAYIEFRKDGYKPDTMYITEIARVDLSIHRDLIPKRDLEYQSWLNHHISEMFEVRRLAQVGQYDEALQIIERLKLETPMVSTVHEMEGGLLVLKQKYRDALNAYRLAVKYDPERVEAVKMVKYLETTFGFAKEVDMADITLPKDTVERAIKASTESKPSERLPSSQKTDNRAGEK